MKRNTLILLFLAAVIGFSSCQGQSGVQQLSVEGFQQKMSKASEKIILDLRTPDEYTSGHLAEATLMNYYDRDFKTRIQSLDKTKPVFVYCATGIRSNSAAKVLINSGFTEVYHLQGGINAWAGSGKPVVK